MAHPTLTIAARPHRDHDVIVVGARVAGAATALLLARQGLDVLLVDRAARGSDTTSTHAMLGPAIELLDRWGLLGEVAATGAPPIEETIFTYESESLYFDLRGRALFAPRRSVFDALLADAALRAGAEVRFQTRVRELHRAADGGVDGVVLDTEAGPAVVRAPLVVGADGIRSFVARQVGAEVTHQGAEASGSVMGYYRDLGASPGYHWYHSRYGAAGSIPTDGGLTVVFAAASAERFRRDMRADPGSGFDRMLREVAPDLAELVQGAELVGRTRSWPGERSFARRAAGPGWVLVGDAGSYTDPMTAHGMTAALRDAQACADTVVSTLGGVEAAPSAWARYEAERDAIAIPMIEAIDEVVAFRHPIERVQQAHIALSKLVNAEAQHLRTRETVPSAA